VRLAPLLLLLAATAHAQLPAGVAIDADGPAVSLGVPLPNFAEVSTSVYRSGQPEGAGVKLAKQLGIRSILDLRLKVDDEEEESAGTSGIAVLHVPMNGVYSPTFEQVDRALAVLTDPRRTPVLVHCHYGKDRTGVVIASYRVAVQGWSIEKAAGEARSFGCCAPFFLTITDWLTYYMEHRGRITAP